MEVKCSNTDNKELLKALKPIEEAHRILEEIIDENCPLMYGPPEVMFSPKELAEMRLREEVIQQVERAELDAEEWKNLMVEIVSSDITDFRFAQELLEERIRKGHASDEKEE